jgi:hypothetical protein
LDALFIVSLLVAVLCAGVLAADVLRSGFWSWRAPSSSLVGPSICVVLAADEANCAEPAGFKLLS